ncbi:restriction endonuclease [Thiolapillus sp.]
MIYTTWMVRAEVGGKYFNDFKEKGIVAVGWSELGDLSSLKNREAFRDAVKAQWPSWNRMAVGQSTGMLYRFVREMKKGDRVLTYDPSRRVYLIGKIVSDYFYDPDLIEEDPNNRKVEWLDEIPRDNLKVTTKNSLGSIATLFQLPEEAVEDIEGILLGDSTKKETDTEADEADEIESLLKDIQSKAIEFTKDRVSKLEWDEVQELVAGLLRTMGYKTRISPAGPDRGKDIVASPDGFGFESPRIVVEVKHRPGSSMGSQEIRSYLGGRHKNDKGLYVSTGGFTKDAYYEAERANIPLTLMNMDELVETIIEYYDTLDINTQRLIPLKKVYWPS